MLSFSDMISINYKIMASGLRSSSFPIPYGCVHGAPYTNLADLEPFTATPSPIAFETADALTQNCCRTAFNSMGHLKSSDGAHISGAVVLGH